MEGSADITHEETSNSAFSTNQSVISGPLFDHWSVFWAGFLGSPLAGCLVMAINYRRLLKPKAAIVAVGAGILAIVALLLSNDAARRAGVSAAESNALSLIAAFVTASFAYGFQGQAVRQSVRVGYRLRSRWTACGIGLACTVSILLVLFGGALLGFRSITERQVRIGNSYVVYSDSATKADATALGEALKRIGYLGARGTTVKLSRDNDSTTIVSFVLRDGTWNDPSIVRAFENMVRAVAPAIGGLPIKLRFLSTSELMKKEEILQ